MAGTSANLLVAHPCTCRIPQVIDLFLSYLIVQCICFTYDFWRHGIWMRLGFSKHIKNIAAFSLIGHNKVTRDNIFGHDDPSMNFVLVAIQAFHEFFVISVVGLLRFWSWRCRVSADSFLRMQMSQFLYKREKLWKRYARFECVILHLRTWHHFPIHQLWRFLNWRLISGIWQSLYKSYKNFGYWSPVSSIKYRLFHSLQEYREPNCNNFLKTYTGLILFKIFSSNSLSFISINRTPTAFYSRLGRQF